DGYNTGVQSSGFDSPLRYGTTLDISPEDAERLGIVDGETVKVVSRRGTVTAPARIDAEMRPGLTFMAIHYPEQVDVNKLTIEEWEPRSGTAEFKAAPIRIDTLGEGGRRRAAIIGGGRSVSESHELGRRARQRRGAAAPQRRGGWASRQRRRGHGAPPQWGA